MDILHVESTARSTFTRERNPTMWAIRGDLFESRRNNSWQKRIDVDELEAEHLGGFKRLFKKLDKSLPRFAPFMKNERLRGNESELLQTFPLASFVPVLSLFLWPILTLLLCGQRLLEGHISLGPRREVAQALSRVYDEVLLKISLPASSLECIYGFAHGDLWYLSNHSEVALIPRAPRGTKGILQSHLLVLVKGGPYLIPRLRWEGLQQLFFSLRISFKRGNGKWWRMGVVRQLLTR
ncbi:hypothetical protein CRG98_032815 [Punica granatum]|uniref:Uncharacterized protein n=1 Tax=Punica granatum TaxID=22663 RepID=A0A2I0IS41_PUNGR|nr:hypothetical protein CRG98_032815 [Punica granatum]